MSPTSGSEDILSFPCALVCPPSDCLSQNLVNATPPTVLAELFWNFVGVSVKVWRCAWRLAVILRLFLFTFFRSSNLVIFGLNAFRHWGILWTQLVGTVLKLCRCFVKVWRCAWHLAVILRLIFVIFFSQFEPRHFWANFAGVFV